MKVTGSSQPPGGAATPIDLTSDVSLFDVGTLDLAVRVLPLAQGYSAKVPGYLLEAGGKTWVTMEVTGSENIAASTAAPATDTWVVTADIGGQKVTHWVDKNTREIVKTTVALGPGIELQMVK
jgi:hypothetical protein